MEDIKLVEYNNSYAKSIADMWRKSAEGWNGNNGTETEESILKEHEKYHRYKYLFSIKGGRGSRLLWLFLNISMMRTPFI